VRKELTIDHNGKTYIGDIATADRTFLGFEDHGFVTANVSFSWNSAGQGTGHYVLDTPVKDKDGKFLYREGSAYGMDYVIQILKVFGVDSWEAIKGKRAIILHEFNDSFGSIVGIVNIDNDKVFIFKDHAEGWRNR
jgi:hypothetical protein